MSDENDDFLKDLQAQCLTDSQEYLDGFVEDLSGLPQNPLDCFKKIAKQIHSLKGNVQAAGFLEYGKFLHDLETELTAIEAGMKSGEVKIAEEEFPVLEFLFSDAHHFMTTYVQDLKTADLTDKPEFYESRKGAIASIHAWWESMVSPLVKGVPKSQVKAMPTKVEEEFTVESTEPESKAESISHADLSAAEAPVASVKLTSVKPSINTEIDDRPKHYLLCKVGSRYYGVLVSQIVEIISRISFVPLPVKRKDVKGLVNLRGETVSILSLDSILGSIMNPKYLVVCEHSGRNFGFEVEEAERVLVIQNSEFQELPENGYQSNKKNNISHVVHFENKEVMILNMNEVLAG